MGVVCVAAAALTVLSPAAAAHADPTVSEIEKQIDEAWNKLEPLIEQYNHVHSQLKTNRARAATLQKQIEPLARQVQLALLRTGAVSAELYKRGPAAGYNAILVSGTTDTLADQLSFLDHITRQRELQIGDVIALKAKLDAQKKPIDVLVAKLATQDADLASKKKSIESQLTKLQQLRVQAYGAAGNTGSLRPVACPVTYLGGPGGTAAKYACSVIGKPYRWAESGPGGYDCSGLTLASWRAAGVSLPHYTKWQWSATTPVSRANLRPGDLVFYYSDLHHVGLYVGGGWMVHAPTFGDYVRMAQIDRGMPIAGFRRPS
jgi:cell wall-associated NlpC family hydrolase